MNSLKNEKDSLNTISSEVNSKLSAARGAELAEGGADLADKFASVKKNLADKKSTIEECNRQAATFVRTVKVRVVYFFVFLEILIFFRSIFCLQQSLFLHLKRFFSSFSPLLMSLFM